MARQRISNAPEKVRQQRSPLNMKASPELRARIEEAAEAHGLSLTQEVERRLLDSFKDEDALGGRKTAAFVKMLVANIQIIEADLGRGWTDDYEAWQAVREILPTLVARVRPEIPNAERVLALSAGEITLEQMIEEVREELAQMDLPAPRPIHYNALLGTASGGVSPDTIRRMAPENAKPRVEELLTRFEMLTRELGEMRAASRAALEPALQAQLRAKQRVAAMLDQDNNQQAPASVRR